MLLCYHVSNMPPFMEKEKQLLVLCKKLGIETYKLTESDIARTLGEIVGMPAMGQSLMPNVHGNGIGKGSNAMPEVLLFSGLKEAELDAFLASYKETKIAPVALKAIVTPYNVSWSLGTLLVELEQERRAYERKEGK